MNKGGSRKRSPVQREASTTESSSSISDFIVGLDEGLHPEVAEMERLRHKPPKEATKANDSAVQGDNVDALRGTNQPGSHDMFPFRYKELMPPIPPPSNTFSSRSPGSFTSPQGKAKKGGQATRARVMKEKRNNVIDAVSTELKASPARSQREQKENTNHTKSPSRHVVSMNSAQVTYRMLQKQIWLEEKNIKRLEREGRRACNASKISAMRDKNLELKELLENCNRMIAKVTIDVKKCDMEIARCSARKDSIVKAMELKTFNPAQLSNFSLAHDTKWQLTSPSGTSNADDLLVKTSLKEKDSRDRALARLTQDVKEAGLNSCLQLQALGTTLEILEEQLSKGGLAEQSDYLGRLKQLTALALRKIRSNTLRRFPNNGEKHTAPFYLTSLTDFGIGGARVGDGEAPLENSGIVQTMVSDGLEADKNDEGQTREDFQDGKQCSVLGVTQDYLDESIVKQFVDPTLCNFEKGCKDDDTELFFDQGSSNDEVPYQHDPIMPSFKHRETQDSVKTTAITQKHKLLISNLNTINGVMPIIKLLQDQNNINRKLLTRVEFFRILCQAIEAVHRAFEKQDERQMDKYLHATVNSRKNEWNGRANFGSNQLNDVCIKGDLAISRKSDDTLGSPGAIFKDVRSATVNVNEASRGRITQETMFQHQKFTAELLLKQRQLARNIKDQREHNDKLRERVGSKLPRRGGASPSSGFEGTMRMKVLKRKQLDDKIKEVQQRIDELEKIRKKIVERQREEEKEKEEKEDKKEEEREGEGDEVPLPLEEKQTEPTAVVQVGNIDGGERNCDVATPFLSEGVFLSAKGDTKEELYLEVTKEVEQIKDDAKEGTSSKTSSFISSASCTPKPSRALVEDKHTLSMLSETPKSPSSTTPGAYNYTTNPPTTPPPPSPSSSSQSPPSPSSTTPTPTPHSPSPYTITPPKPQSSSGNPMSRDIPAMTPPTPTENNMKEGEEKKSDKTFWPVASIDEELVETTRSHKRKAHKVPITSDIPLTPVPNSPISPNSIRRVRSLGVVDPDGEIELGVVRDVSGIAVEKLSYSYSYSYSYDYSEDTWNV